MFEKNAGFSSLVEMYRILKKYRSIRMISVKTNAISICNGMAQSCSAIVLGKIFALFATHSNFDSRSFATLICVEFSLSALAAFLTGFEVVLLTKLREYTLLVLGRRTINSINGGFHTNSYGDDSGKTFNLITGDTTTYMDAMELIGKLGKSIALAVCAIVFTFHVTPMLTISILATACIYFLSLTHLQRLTGALFMEVSSVASISASHFFQTLALRRTVHVYGFGSVRTMHYISILKKRIRMMIRANRPVAVSTGLSFSSFNMLNIVTLVIYATFLRKGIDKIGSIVTVNAMAIYLWTASQELAASFSTFTKYKPSIKRLSRVISSTDAYYRFSNSSPCNGVPAICLENLSLTYSGGGMRVLDKVSVTIHTGERILITGNNGSGKSTLFKIISGEIVPDSGEMSIAGNKIISGKNFIPFPLLIVVTQTPEIFRGTVIQNILIGNQAASREDVEYIAQVVGLDKETLDREDAIEDGGAQLSGGQRQKISLARALLSQSSILLLDEPTSALDPESASKIMRYLLKDLSRSKTIVIISHDANIPLEYLDRHLHLVGGSIVERSASFPHLTT